LTGLTQGFSARIFSTRSSYLLRRDTTTPLHSTAGIHVNVRPLQPEDAATVIRQQPMRRRALRKGLSTCYVATAEGALCYVQWLIDPSQNELIAREFTGLCPPLSHDEMLLHGGYTFPPFRAEAVASAAMAQICGRAAAGGAHWLYIFVAVDDIAMLKTCSRLGFRPHQVCTDTWRFFRLTQSFEQLPRGAQYTLE